MARGLWKVIRIEFEREIERVFDAETQRALRKTKRRKARMGDLKVAPTKRAEVTGWRDGGLPRIIL
jgi:hypothetical protein